jgi:hypothetical protein
MSPSEITKNGGIALCAPIAPYTADPAHVREMIEAYGAFVEVHVATPLEECERRDRKGLYQLAREGKIKEFTGISDPYEEPPRSTQNVRRRTTRSNRWGWSMSTTAPRPVQVLLTLESMGLVAGRSSGRELHDHRAGGDQRHQRHPPRPGAFAQHQPADQRGEDGRGLAQHRRLADRAQPRGQHDPAEGGEGDQPADQPRASARRSGRAGRRVQRRQVQTGMKKAVDQEEPGQEGEGIGGGRMP